LIDDVPVRVLAIYAHPDDPEVSCAGTLARWAAAGSEVHLIIGTRGDKGTRDPSTDPERLATRRAEEARAAAELLGMAGHEMLGFLDGELDNTRELRRLLVERIRRVRPEVVMGPDPTAVFFGNTYVNHRDHREIGYAVLDACAPAAGSPLYFPAAGEAHHPSQIFLSGTLAPDSWVDVRDTIEVKVRALLCHGSQLGDERDLAADAVRQRAAAAGQLAGVPYAEGFRVVRLR
jgi:LmbE family N-acetylglucosaminyl deacetylase